YCHNSALLVSVGETVERGQVVSRSGTTGRRTGPHVPYPLELGHVPMGPLLFHGGGGSAEVAANSAGFSLPKMGPPPTVDAQTVEPKRVELHGKDFPGKAKLTAFVQGCEKE